MKKFIFVFYILFETLHLPAQVSFIGFDDTICHSLIADTYTYLNYSPSSFKIYRNGNEILNRSYVYHSLSFYCNDLIFINDSTGFLVSTSATWAGDAFTTVEKTSNYGNTWTSIGMSRPGYRGLYIMNQYYAYLVCGSNFIQVTKCSDINPPNLTYPPSTANSFIYDVSITTDIFKKDTIFGNSLCNIDSLNFFVKNSLNDTIGYHINITSVPLGINEYAIAKMAYTVYPNPAQNKITIDGNSFYNAEIYTVQGEKIIQSSSQTINIDALSKGVYFIRVTNLDGKPSNLKFIKD
jgi:hypothetical protein